jgi:cellulose synthase operon protein C
MLKVACESCQAPYQIDERRVPPAGLKMRCPKCGHSFLVSGAGQGAQESPAIGTPTAAAPRPVPPRPGAARVLTSAGMMGQTPNLSGPKATMMGLAPPSVPPDGDSEAELLPSDFPAALTGTADADLPAIASAALPQAKNVAPTPGPRPPPPLPGKAKASAAQSAFEDPGLPVAATRDLPVAKARAAPPRFANPDADLPAVAAALPVASAGLPTVSAGLPAVGQQGHHGLPVVAPSLPSLVQGQLPVVASALPSVASALPVVAPSLPVLAREPPIDGASFPEPLDGFQGFGEIELPPAIDLPPIDTATDPSQSFSGPAFDATLGSFGEIDLPHELAESVPAPPPPPLSPAAPAKRSDSADFRDIEFDDQRRPDARSKPSTPSRPPPASATRTSASQPEGGTSFGEMDLGVGDGSALEAEPIAQAGPNPGTTWGTEATQAAITSVELPKSRAVAPERQVGPRKRSTGAIVAAAAAVVVLLGGASLQITPFGAFGYLTLSDLVHAHDYERAAANAITSVDRSVGEDTYDAARSAADAVFASHAKLPRARSLTAYAAVVDFATTLRFGPDAARGSRGKQLLAELPSDVPVRYADLARAVQNAVNGNWDSASGAVQSAGARYSGDPIQLDVNAVLGELGLAARQGSAAVAAFKRALDLSSDARGHFGLARAYDLLGDGAKADNEVRATLAASPNHPGALILRARRSRGSDPALALTDIARVLEGDARQKASPMELSDAYAVRALIDLGRGATADAREAFAQAVKLNPNNVDALDGEGELFMAESRYAEALARFDTALQLDSASPRTIANDAEAKVSLERLADAKQQLQGALARFPKSIPILLVLGKVEQHLENNEAAEADLRAAVANVSPSDHDAIAAYVALAELLAARGQVAEAKGVLDQAASKLPPSSALERSFGQMAELLGDADAAIAHYRNAITKDPHDLAAHFRLASALRRVGKYDSAMTELDMVANVDANYPGLELERGLLFEQSGDVEKAIEQFKAALARAPNDPDLELRVGAAYVAIDRPDDALPMLHKVLEQRSSSAEANHYVGRALMLKGESSLAEALHYLKRAAELDPNRAEFHVYVARAATESAPAQLELARDEVDRTLAIDGINADAYWQKGVIERIEGAVDDALKDEKHALELRPSRYEAHATLAECHEDKNENAAALSEWAAAIAGEGAAPGGDVPHPYWRYRYGRLLAQKGDRVKALALLLPASEAAEKLEVRPAWLAPLEFLTGQALESGGRRGQATEHYKRYLEIAPVSSPDRSDAQSAIARLTGSR